MQIEGEREGRRDGLGAMSCLDVCLCVVGVEALSDTGWGWSLPVTNNDIA